MGPMAFGKPKPHGENSYAGGKIWDPEKDMSENLSGFTENGPYFGPSGSCGPFTILAIVKP